MSEVQNKIIKFPAADGIRGLAVLIVLVVHAMVMFYPESYNGLAGAGKIGVWLFFVLSSFLLTNIFMHKGFNYKSILSYITGRVIRILPLYAFTLLAYSAFGYFSLQDAFTIFKMNAPWGHLWTIAVEFKFYFILPFIAFLLIKLSNKPVIMVITAVIIMLAQQLYLPFYEVNPSSTDVTGYISCFIPGMVAAILLANGKTVSNKTSDLILLFILAGVFISIPYIRLITLGVREDGYLLNKHVHFSIAWSVFVYLTLISTGYINKALSFNLLRVVGKWSFSIYLFHWLVYTQISPKHQHSLTASILAMLLSIVIGATIFYAFEKPMEKMRHLLMRKI